ADRAGLALLLALALRRGRAGLAGRRAGLRWCTWLRARGGSRLSGGSTRRGRTGGTGRGPFGLALGAFGCDLAFDRSGDGRRGLGFDAHGHGLDDELVRIIDDADGRLVEHEIANVERVVDLDQRREIDIDR